MTTRSTSATLLVCGLLATAMVTASFAAPPPSLAAASPHSAATAPTGATKPPGAFGQALANLWHALLPQHDVQVITVTDATPQGALLRTPSPTNPVYYIAINAGFHDFGAAIGGIKSPPTKDVIATIGKVLAKQGYLPATQAHPPTQILLFTWGTLNVDRFDASGTAMSPTDAPQVNRRQMLRFLGAYKLGLVAKDPHGFDDTMDMGLAFHDATQSDFLDVASDDLYVAAIASYDYQAMLQKKKVLLWTTKISCPSIGLDLAESLPVMLAIAGPNIGRETPKPVWINASEKYKPEVQIGDAKVLEMFDPEKMPVVDATQAGKKKPAPAKK